jgi:pantoate kinase
MRVDGTDAARTGSIGAGIVINEGVTAHVHPARSNRVIVRRIGNQGSPVAGEYDSAPLNTVLAMLGVTAEVTTVCRLPIGAGFGLSAAAILSTITALNAAFSLGLSAREIAGMAHEAEILHRSGLGDVAACQDGGLACRMGPGVDADIIRWKEWTEPIAAVSFGALETSHILDDAALMERIASAFPTECPGNPADFFTYSRRFAEEVGLISDASREVLSACDRHSIPASMTMLGNGVFACGQGAHDVLSRFGEAWSLTVADGGVHLVEAGS